LEIHEQKPFARYFRKIFFSFSRKAIYGHNLILSRQSSVIT